MTSSPSPIPQTRKFSSSAAVAEFKQTTLLVWQYSASLLSSSFVLGPVVIQPLLIASATSFISSSEMSGGLNGITLFSIIVLPLPFLLFLSLSTPSPVWSSIPFQPTNPLSHAISSSPFPHSALLSHTVLCGFYCFGVCSPHFFAWFLGRQMIRHWCHNAPHFHPSTRPPIPSSPPLPHRHTH